MMRTLARLRVPLGFASAVAAFWLARPTPGSITLGLAIALAGEAVRVWAAGHLDRSAGITTSGPYVLVRHPLYLGSAIIAIGFIAAARTWPAGLLTAAYITTTYVAAIRSEEAALDSRFPGGYAAYRSGRAGSDGRTFSLARVRANREHRTVIGVLVAFGLLALR